MTDHETAIRLAWGKFLRSGHTFDFRKSNVLRLPYPVELQEHTFRPDAKPTDRSRVISVTCEDRISVLEAGGKPVIARVFFGELGGTRIELDVQEVWRHGND